MARTADGLLTWRAARERAVIVADSPLGLRRRDQAFVNRLTVTGTSEPITIDERLSDTTRQASRASRPRTRAHAQRDERGSRAEASPSNLPARQRQQVHRYGPAYEEFYEEVKAGTRAPRKDGWAFPALFRTPDSKWLLISESGFDGGYCGTHLNAAAPGVYRIAFPKRGEGKGVGQVNPISTLPWTLPWRLVIIGDAAVGLLELDLVNDLSPPTKITDTSWIKTGRAAWSWWSEGDSPKQAERLNAFTDLTAEMTWEYSLVDANWNFMQSGRIEDVVAHAREKGVGLLFGTTRAGRTTTLPRRRGIACTSATSDEPSSRSCANGA